MKKEPLIILGFGGNAIDFFETISALYDIIGFVDDDEKKCNLNYKDIGVHKRDFLGIHPNVKVISMIGSEKSFKTRNKIIRSFNISEERFANALHPDASVSKQAILGRDVVIMPGVVVTANAKIGNHVFILANSVLHHDVEVEDYSLIGSNVTIAGHVKIGRNCFIGSTASIKSYVTIGTDSLIGMAANVVKDIPANSICIGNPARCI